MNAMVLPRYLMGSQKAILEIAASRWSLLVGAIFVLSAGFAREYDGEDLLHEPWHALRPMAASLISGTALFLLIHAAALMRRKRSMGEAPSFPSAYRTFIGLFWMTAPMAWLYAIPYERFMSPVDAIEVNLWTLALVALWRVLLITRVISVLYGISDVQAFFIVMLFADAVALAAVHVVPMPIIDIMGGIRHTARDELLKSVTLGVIILGNLTGVVWVIGALISAASMKPKWKFPDRAFEGLRVRGLFLTSIVSILVFVPLLVMSQPQQMKKHHALSLFESGAIDEALVFMSDHGQSAFPPHWNPPPQIGYYNQHVDLNEVRNAMERDWPADWVALVYIDKVGRQLSRGFYSHRRAMTWQELVTEFHWYSGWQDDQEARASAQFLIDHDSSLSDEDRDALQQIVDMESDETEQ